MSEPFLAEIIMVGFNFPPRGWAMCDGQILPINQNQSLYSLLGTTYGRDGRTSFALPDMRGRVPVHSGSGAGPGLTNRPLGSEVGEENVTLTEAQLPAHTHKLQGTNSKGDSTDPNGKVLAKDRRTNIYRSATAADKAMGDSSLSSVGGGQSHANVQPFTCVTFIIALQGLFPSRN